MDKTNLFLLCLYLCYFTFGGLSFFACDLFYWIFKALFFRFCVIEMPLYGEVIPCIPCHVTLLSLISADANTSYSPIFYQIQSLLSTKKTWIMYIPRGLKLHTDSNFWYFISLLVLFFIFRCFWVNDWACRWCVIFIFIFLFEMGYLFYNWSWRFFHIKKIALNADN